ncbi:MAG: ribonuclease R [Ruminiclostridium sp.]|nr:ribonuclease R [Ruminiclostridium sp.]
MDLESLIIATLFENGGGMTIKQIAYKNDLPKKYIDKLKNTSKVMIRNKVIFRTNSDQLYISNMRSVFSGKVSSLSRTYGFVTNLITGEDSFVSGGKLKGAVPGDTVIAREISEKTEQRSSTAEVLAVLDQTEELFGGIIVKEGIQLKVLPDTLGCPPLSVMKVKEQIKEGDKVLFSIRKRGEHHSEHIVDIIKSLGSSEYAKSATEAYLIQNNIPVDFSAEAREQAKQYANAVIDEKQAAKRLDLRDLPIFTIDGADTKDIDDAISVERIENGYKLGVHIADVSHYVTEGSPLDNDAFERGTSVYIADKVIPMLPKELSNGICSLNPGVDRLAFSCIMEISNKGTVKKYKFAKTVIRSRVQGVYSEVNAILDNTANEAIKAKYSEVLDCIPVMKELADILIKKRKDRGAPEIQSSESKVICDENGICVDIKPRVQGVSEGIIEEFMLMANNSAAKTAMKKEIPFVYRVHENPPAEKIESLKSTLEALGINPLGINEKADAKTFAKLLEKTSDDPRSVIINRIVLRTMAKAKYSEQPLGHFGLVLAEYAHFTSPIRRYADLSIHRILTDYVAKKGGDKLRKKYGDFSVRAASQATKTELSAVAAERNCEDFYAAEYMKNHIGEEFDGIISGVLGSGLFVELPNTVEGKIDVRSLSDNYFEVRNGIALYDSVTGTMYTMGDKVRVKCINANVNLGQTDFELIKVYDNISDGAKPEKTGE